LGGQEEVVVLDRRSLRSESFTIWNTHSAEDTIPVSRTYFGWVEGRSEWRVAASLEKDGLRARFVNSNGKQWELTPAPQLGAAMHRLQRPAKEPSELCGSDEARYLQHATGPGGRAVQLPPPSGGSLPPNPTAWDGKLQKSRIAFDATYSNWLREGQTVSGVTAGVEYQLALNEICYAADALITYELTGIVIRQQPYYQTTGAGNLLSEFGNEWDWNQGHIPRESAVLLADYQGDGIAGLAWVGTLGGGLAYAGLFWDRGYGPGIIAHEVGHNWGAGHIDCWPWGGSAMCGAWLLLGPDTSNIVQSRADWLGLPEMPRHEIQVRPYADPDWTATDVSQGKSVDVLLNDHDANEDWIRLVDVTSPTPRGATVTIEKNAGPDGRDLLHYLPDIRLPGGFTEEVWYTSSDPFGNEHDTPMVINVNEKKAVVEWKFEEGGGTTVVDHSGRGNHGEFDAPLFPMALEPTGLLGASQADPWTQVSNLFDGSPTTSYSTPNQGPVSTSFTRDVTDGTWVELDFGQVVDIIGLRYLDLTTSSQWTTESQLWFSLDQSFSSLDQGESLVHENRGSWWTELIEPVQARYVRWEVTGQHSAGSTASLGGRELEFLTDSGLAPLPSPTVFAASHHQANYPASQLLDESNTTVFRSDSQGPVSQPLTTNPSNGTWLQAQWPSAVDIEGVQFTDHSDQSERTGTSTLFFEQSPVFTASSPSQSLLHSYGEHPLVVAFAKQTADHVRWEVNSKGPFAWANTQGGRELTFLTDWANSPGFSRVPGPFGDALNITGPVQLNQRAAVGVPTGGDDSFTVNLFVNPNLGVQDGTLIGGFGDPNGIHRMFEVRYGKLFFAGHATPAILATNSWNMITATFDPSSGLKVYLGGQEVYSGAASFLASSPQLHLAPHNPLFPDAQFSGLLDDFEVWDFAMTGPEVADLFLGGGAHGPSPRQREALVPTNPTLKWVPARGVSRHDVYLGTDPQAVGSAQIGDPDYYGRLSNPQLALQGLHPLTWYYWRVDEYFPLTGKTIPGPVWCFRTELPWTTSVYEGFADGFDGQHIAGLGGGTGFNANWWAPSNNGYYHRTGSIGAYPSNLPFVETDGFFERRAVSNLAMYGDRHFDTNQLSIDLSGDATYYLSFALNLDGGSNDMTAMVGLFGHGPSGSVLGGIENGRWSISGLAGNATGSAAFKNRTHFVVMRITAQSSGNDTVHLKVYDSLTEQVHMSDALLSGVGSGAHQWDLMTSGADSGGALNYLWLRAGGGSTLGNDDVQVDEIRVGRSWSDVTGL